MADAILKKRIHAEMVAAMKGGDKGRLGVLRMVLSEIGAQEADHPEADPLVAVTGYAKKLRKAQADMERLNQAERAAALKAELVVVEEFLPKQMDDAELEKLVGETIAAMGAVSSKDAGKVIGAVMKAAGGTADSMKVRALLQAKLP